RIDLRSLVTEVTRFIELELDFPREVASTERLAKTLADRDDVVVPRVYRDLCGPHVIVLEDLEGVQVARAAELVGAARRPGAVARRIRSVCGATVCEHGSCHGDPRPGNLLERPDGRIGRLDLGLCKERPPGFARQVGQMMVSAMIGDGDAA